MACGACPSKNGRKSSYVHTDKSGTTKVYATEVEAKAAVARRGGSYKEQK